ncbi:aldose 1-epimerase family protein [Christiangramia salexigens]|uniref:Aldose epimerase n=1 Tax=Christiangramia salexigens TaxID=1913577 RepID=A0A1L3J1Z5_9FLAO|nr:aldose 1-epimerase family protein [Christiangramia salexigens]APG59162.1 aldose epimerase [Christiangramia salexigens]
MYTIENDHLKIEVHEKGAELCSILNKKNNLEYIWQADPAIWGSSAPNLFPVIGVLKDGFFKFEGERYEMPKHGLIRNNPQIHLKERSQNQLVFEYIYSTETLKLYPFKFNFKIAFTLREQKLEVSHHIINLDSREMLFSLGGHPAFNIQHLEGEKISDYFLEFDHELSLNTFPLNEAGLVKNEAQPFTENDTKLWLTKNIFDHDALIFKNIASKKVSLNSKKYGKWLSLTYSDFKNLGVWAKPGAPYVCIEPWLGIADTEDTDQNFKNKEGLLSLSPAGEYTAEYTIEIH